MKIKNILAVRNDRFGEFLLNIPALRALKEAYPGSKLTLVVSPYLRELAGCLDCADEVITWENRNHKFSEVLECSRQLKAKKFDLCVIFNPSREFNIISFLAGIPRRIGYNRKLGILLTRRIEDRKHLGERHEVEYNLQLAELAGAKTTNPNPALRINQDALKGLSGELGALKDSVSLVAVHPWTSDPIKQWPLDNFYALTRKLMNLPNLKVVIVGGQEEMSKAARVFNEKEDGLLNLTGKTSLKQLAAILKRCKLLISGDSGPVHLAASVGTPTIAIFRSDIPAKGSKRWGPWGSGHIVIEKDNLLEITVGEVFNKVQEGLKK